MPLDPNRYKQVMRQYATGVMVLTVPDGEGFHAVTVNSVSSVSLQPVLLLVCLEKNARSHELVHRVERFALNILAASQEEIGRRFAYDWEARKTPIAYVAGRTSENGTLIFSESLGYFDCHVVAEYAGGDHTIFLSEVLNAEVQDQEDAPLIYYQSRWLKLNP
ncbi:MAG TPA: flavin reductase family protein [Anaerolineae bacterium]|nr:flavin reductase family protein [Anaerolineae bacterium]